MNKTANMLGNKHSPLVLRTGRSVVATICLLSFSSNLALAQVNAEETNPQNVDNTPISARPALATLPELPVQVLPEQLDAPKTYTINPENFKGRHTNSRNSWSSATLTQSTGISASSIQASALKLKSNQPEMRASSTDILLGADENVLLDIGPVFAGPSLEDGLVDFDSSLRAVLFDTPGGIDVTQSIFKLDLSGQFCLGTTAECDANVTDTLELAYAKNITGGKHGGLNLQITPRAGFRFDEDSQSAVVGAMVRIGDDLRLGSEMKPNTWFVFAGAEAESVSYGSDAAQRLTGGQFYLQDHIVIGDTQAGLGYKLGNADLALTYFKRQTKVNDLSYDEEAAAFSITWKR